MNSVWINPALQSTVCTGVPSSFWFDPVVHFSFLFYTSNSCIATSSSIFFFFFYLCNGAISLPPFHHYLQPSSVDFVPWKLSCCSAAFHSFVPYSHDTGFSVIIKHTFFFQCQQCKKNYKKSTLDTDKHSLCLPCRLKTWALMFFSGLLWTFQDSDCAITTCLSPSVRKVGVKRESEREAVNQTDSPDSQCGILHLQIFVLFCSHLGQTVSNNSEHLGSLQVLHPNPGALHLGQEAKSSFSSCSWTACMRRIITCYPGGTWDPEFYQTVPLIIGTGCQNGWNKDTCNQM